MSSPGTCAVCGAAALRPHLRVAGDSGPDGLIPTTKEFGVALGDIARCASCGHMQLDPLPDEERLREAYGEAGPDDYVDEESGQRATARALLERIEAHTGRGPLLDVGAWLGFLLAEARDRGWEPVGLEPSEAAAAWAHEQLRPRRARRRRRERSRGNVRRGRDGRRDRAPHRPGRGARPGPAR